jgi:hypothetical protein
MDAKHDITVFGLPPQYPADRLGRALGTRICVIDDDGIIRSPHVREYIWCNRHQEAVAWDDDEAIRGKAGLHAVWHLPRAVPAHRDLVVLHLAAHGRMAVGAVGFRAQRVEVLEIVHRRDRRLHDLLLRHWGAQGVKVHRRARGLRLDRSGIVSWAGRWGGRRAGFVVCDGEIDSAWVGSQIEFKSCPHAMLYFGASFMAWPRDSSPPKSALPVLWRLRRMVQVVMGSS